LWGNGPAVGEASWQRALREELDHWERALGANERVPEGWAEAISEDPHQRVLERAGLRYEGKFDFAVVTRWSVDSVIGYVYSTSVLSHAVLQEDAPAFEYEIRARLLRESPNDEFEQHTSFAYELARLH
jgi:hypothetical protein